MKYALYVLMSCISLIWTMIWMCYVLKNRRKKRHSIRTIPTVMMLTAGLFVSIWLVLIPVYYVSYEYGDKYNYLRPLLMSLYNTIRVFILEGDYEFLIEAVKEYPLGFHIAYTLYAAVLLVVAPVMTFGNVLYLFKNFSGELRFNLNINRSVYIMSKLNERSVVLAKSILAQNVGSRKSLIVFTDVSQQDEEEQYELILEAKNMNAICIKKNISNLNLKNKKGFVEIFFIDENESDNVNQAVSLTRELDERRSTQKIKIFAFANSDGSAYIINSLRYNQLLDNAKAKEYGEEAFKLRRVDSIRQLVWNEVQKMKIFETAKDKTISVLLVGFGRYGFEFLKMIMWYCQIDGYRLEINIVDKMGTKDDDTIESLINRKCPELLCYQEHQQDYDMNYSIKCFSGIDMDTDAFCKMMEYQGDDEEKAEIARRLRRTTIAIVALGDDDINVEISVYLRILFDKIGKVSADKKKKIEDECPQIYAVVYDERKSAEGDTGFLINHTEIPYNIWFIGSTVSQYSYNNIYDRKIEAEALKRHMNWIAVKESTNGELKSAGRTDEEIMNAGCDISAKLDEEMYKFQRFEYFRLSSIASCIHTNVIDKYFSDQVDSGDDLFRKKTEHMRWNAYTMVNGYTNGSERLERAKIHNKIVPWSELTKYDKAKD